MDRRIYGLETEFGITCTYLENGTLKKLAPDTVATALLRCLGGSTTNYYLDNGSRLYQDVGAHPEYATAECDSLFDLIAQDKAGERILEGLSLHAEARLRADGTPATVYLFKNNTDSTGRANLEAAAHSSAGISLGATYGCHENYLVGRRTNMPQLYADLLPFLITRQLIAGAGKVLPTMTGAVYCLSQRAEYMDTDVSGTSTKERPMINTRDEPHADPEKYRRLHMIVGDSNMSETTTLLKVGSTDLVLSMLEAGLQLPRMEFADPARAIREVSRDITGTAPIRLADGTETNAQEVQRRYFEAARAYAEDRGIAGRDPVRRVLDLWGRTLVAVGTGNLSLVDREIDWVIKYKMIGQYIGKHNLSWDAPRVAQLDLAYSDIRRGRGLYYVLESRGMVERVVTDLAVFQAKVLPPQTTRARLRGAFLKAAKQSNAPASADWVNLRINGSAQKVVQCKDPFRAHDDRVTRLMAQL